MSKKRTYFVLFILVLLAIIPINSVKAASSLKINMEGFKTSYSGPQVKVSLNNTNLNISETPGITINGIALLPYDNIFKSGLGATCTYSSKTKEVIVKQFGNTVRLTLDSSIAYVNGKKTTVPLKPRKVYYFSSKATKIMIPSRFVAEALGYTYHWDSSSSTVKLSSPYQIYYSSAWHLYEGTKGKVTINGNSVNVSSMPSVILSSNAFVQARKVFADSRLGTTYTYNSANRTITISNDEAKIVYQLDSTTAYVNDKQFTLKVAPKLIKDNVTNKSYAMIPAKFTAESLGFRYTWNSNTKTSQITTTKQKIWSWDDAVTDKNSTHGNTLQSILLEKQENEEYIKFTGKKKLDVQTSYVADNCLLTVTISDLNNDMKALKKAITKSINVQHVTISECDNGICIITLTLKKDAAYYESVSGASYAINFCESEAEVTGDSITLTKPDNVDFNEIKDEDLYYNKQFKIIIPGDCESYYQDISDSLPEHISSVKCSLDSDGDTVLTFSTTKIMGYKLSDNGDTFTITVGAPGDIYQNIVVLDAGHGGTDPGCISNGLHEKDINFGIIYRYCKSYFNDSDSPVKAYWTRTTDTKIDLYARGAFAKSVDADLFISLHMNSAGSSSVNGTETYYCSSNNGKNSFGVTSKMLASYFQSNWPSKLGMSTSRGVKTANYVVIKKNTVPAILIELGFMTSTKDISILGNTTNQKKAAKSFYQTVCDFFEKYPTGR